MSLPATADKTDAALSVDTGAGKSVAVTEALKQAISGTVGRTEYFFKKDLGAAKMVGGADQTPSGTMIASVQLDGSFDDTIMTLKKQFINYTFKDVTLVIKCSSPFSTASGTAQLYYNADPENPFNEADARACLDSAVRLSESMQVSAKTDATLQLPDEQLKDLMSGSKYRWCKKATNSQPRTERFGEVGMLVRGTPALGDGSSWSVTLTGLAIFEGPTLNSDVSFRRAEIHDGPAEKCELIQDEGGIKIEVGSACNGPSVVGHFSSRSAPTFKIGIGEVGDDEVIETHYISVAAAAYHKNIGAPTSYFVFPTQIQSVTQLEAPHVITFDDNFLLHGDIVYEVDEDEYAGPRGSLSRSQMDNISTKPGYQSPSIEVAARRRLGLASSLIQGARNYFWGPKSLITSN